VISLGRHLGSLLLGLTITALLFGGLAVALPVGGWPAELAGVLSTAARSAAIIDAGPRTADPDTVAAATSRLRAVSRAVTAAAPVAITPATAGAAGPQAADQQTTAPGTAATPRTHRTPKSGSAAAGSGTTGATKTGATKTAATKTGATKSGATKTAATTGADASADAEPKQVSRSTAKPAGRGPAAALLAATNAERAEAGCDPLRADSRLSAAAQRHAADMAANDYFSHTDQDGGDSADRIHDAGFTGSRTAENIAYGQQSAAEVMADWMGSSGHRRNILNCDYDRIGLGYDSRGDYWVQTFGG
jgi:uncharacterized protein YkwD